MTALLGPCPCRCGQPVVWNGKRWRNVGQRAGGHTCPKGAPCGAYMPQYSDRCARRTGHVTEHRSSYAMANARRRRAA